MFLTHWALIGFTKVYFFQIPEDFLLASSAVPALYLFYKEYINSNLHISRKPKAKILNLLLILLCCIIGLSFTITLIHVEGEYWTAVEKGITDAVAAFSDFNISIKMCYYDAYDYTSFTSAGNAIIAEHPDGVIVSPTIPQITRNFTDHLNEFSIPYIFIDSNIPDLHPLAFYGQNSERSGYFAAKMLMLMSDKADEIVIFRQIKEGIIGSNQQENRDKGFRIYMKEHFPSCRITELNLHPKYPIEDEQLLDAYFAEHPNVTWIMVFPALLVRQIWPRL